MYYITYSSCHVYLCDLLTFCIFFSHWPCFPSSTLVLFVLFILIPCWQIKLKITEKYLVFLVCFISLVVFNYVPPFSPIKLLFILQLALLLAVLHYETGQVTAVDNSIFFFHIPNAYVLLLVQMLVQKFSAYKEF